MPLYLFWGRTQLFLCFEQQCAIYIYHPYGQRVRTEASWRSKQILPRPCFICPPFYLKQKGGGGGDFFHSPPPFGHFPRLLRIFLRMERRFTDDCCCLLLRCDRTDERPDEHIRPKSSWSCCRGWRQRKKRRRRAQRRPRPKPRRLLKACINVMEKKKMHMIHPIQLLSACRLRLLYTTPQRVCETTPTEVMGSTKR